VRYLQDELPETLDPYMEKMTLDHLLKMSSGWKADIITNRIKGGEQFDPVQACLTAPFTHEPGTHWRYNNMDTYLAGVVVQKLTGKTLEAYLREKLLTPLGVDTLCYEVDSRGFNTGAWGMHVTTETLAKLGLFMLQKGNWEGAQLLDSAWFDKAMTVKIIQYSDVLNSDPRTDGNQLSDWKSGYCYQSWACHIPGSVRADGMWGQYSIVLPDKNAVVAMTTICSDREAQLNAVWKHVYPHL
jgi:CubicO group peptidase (beta-lactamase class C family)